MDLCSMQGAFQESPDPFMVRNSDMWVEYKPGRDFLETEIKKQRREEAPTSLQQVKKALKSLLNPPLNTGLIQSCSCEHGKYLEQGWGWLYQASFYLPLNTTLSRTLDHLENLVKDPRSWLWVQATPPDGLAGKAKPSCSLPIFNRHSLPQVFCILGGS